MKGVHNLTSHLTTTLVLPVLIHAIQMLDRPDEVQGLKWAERLQTRLDALPLSSAADALEKASRSSICQSIALWRQRSPTPKIKVQCHERELKVALELFRNSHVLELRAAIRQNLARYAERKPWAARTAPREQVRLTSSLELATPLELELPTGADLKDLENSIILHRALPDLTPLRARDPRLWTRLTHVECWSYMRAKWDIDKKTRDDGAKHVYILQHYFILRRESRALLRNGIARLWWFSHLTHDPKREDPYELTKTLLSLLDIAKVLLEVNFGRAPQIRTGFLDFLRLNGSRLGSSAGQRRLIIRALSKMLNMQGGVTILDSLSCEDVMRLLESELSLAESI